MSRASTSDSAPADRAPADSDGPTKAAPPQLGALFTLGVLAAMAIALSYVRFRLLPSQVRPPPIAFEFKNPMLDALPGEEILMHDEARPGSEICVVVREEGVVLRPFRGPKRVGLQRDLKHEPAYLACSARDVDAVRGACGGSDVEQDTVLYGLSRFGMPIDTKVALQSLQPQRMKWGDREIVVYRAVLERFGDQSGLVTTYLTSEAPVVGLVRREFTMADGHVSRVAFREVIGR